MSVTDKFQELFEYTKELHFKEQERYTRLDQKATWFLASITVLVGLSFHIVDWIVKAAFPITGPLSFFTLTTGVIYFITLFSAWYLFLQILKVKPLAHTNASQLPDFCRQNTLVDFYFSISKRFCEAIRENIDTNEKKARIMNYGHRFLIGVGVVFMVLLILVVSQMHVISYARQSKSNYTNGGFSMNQDEKPSDSAPKPPSDSAPANQADQPNPNVEAPENIHLTEGLNAPIIKKGDTKE